jgi:hypothetical protein
MFEILNLKKETLPFDWMLSTPKFVYTILSLLLVEQIEISTIVDNDFFYCDKRATFQSYEHYVTDDYGRALVNSKYNVCFPHDKITDREKYIRRLERLKELILDKKNFLHFVYVSVSSPNGGNYTIDEIEPIQNIYSYMEKINSLLMAIRPNYKIIVLDTHKPTDIKSSDVLHLYYYDIEKKNNWLELMPELINKCNTIDGLNSGRS